MSDKDKQITYYTVGKLRKALEKYGDDTPMITLPINDNVRLALNLSVIEGAKIGNYRGDIISLDPGLFDVNTGNEIILQQNGNK